MISITQIRMARAALDMSQGQLAEAVGIIDKTVSNSESGKSKLSSETAAKLEAYFISRGLEFTGHDGVRKAPSGLRTYRGRAEFREFYDDLYETAKNVGGPITLYNGVSSNVIGALGEEGVAIQKARMSKIKKNFDFRVIVEEGDKTFFGADYCQYKWLSSNHFNNLTIFTFGSKVGIADFEGDVEVVVIDQQKYADSQRLFFDLAWDNLAKDPS